jgi:hypothetical protein
VEGGTVSGEGNAADEEVCAVGERRAGVSETRERVLHPGHLCQGGDSSRAVDRGRPEQRVPERRRLAEPYSA